MSHLDTNDAQMSMLDHKGTFHKIFNLDYIIKLPSSEIVVMGQAEFGNLYEKCEDPDYEIQEKAGRN